MSLRFRSSNDRGTLRFPTSRQHQRAIHRLVMARILIGEGKQTRP